MEKEAQMWEPDMQTWHQSQVTAVPKAYGIAGHHSTEGWPSREVELHREYGTLAAASDHPKLSAVFPHRTVFLSQFSEGPVVFSKQ